VWRILAGYNVLLMEIQTTRRTNHSVRLVFDSAETKREFMQAHTRQKPQIGGNEYEVMVPTDYALDFDEEVNAWIRSGKVTRTLLLNERGYADPSHDWKQLAQ